MKIRYLVTKEYLKDNARRERCSKRTAERGRKRKHSSSSSSDNRSQRKKSRRMPDDVRIKFMDMRRIKQRARNMSHKPVPSSKPRIRYNDLLYFPKYLRHDAFRLLNALLERGITWTSEGEVNYNNLIYPHTRIYELVGDAIANKKRSNPIGADQFARIMSEVNIPRDMIKNPRRIFIRPLQPPRIRSPTPPPTPPTPPPIPPQRAEDRARHPQLVVGENDSEDEAMEQNEQEEDDDGQFEDTVMEQLPNFVETF